MADYYTLIRQAVQRSDSRTPEARGAIYERARTALLRQLRGHDPPLSDDEITRQRGSLEEAIKKVESEMDEAAVRDGAKSLGKEMASPPPRKARETAPPPPSARPPRARPEPPRREPVAAADEEAEVEGREAAPPPRARRPARPSEPPAAPPPPEAPGRPLRPNPLKERIAPAGRSGGAYGAAAEARHEEDEPAEEESNILAPRFGRTAETRDVEPEPERDRRDDEDDYYDDEYDDDDYDDDDEDGRERRIGGPAFMIGGVVVVLAILGFAFWQRDTVTQMFVGTPEVATIDADVAGEGEGGVPAKNEERVPQPGGTDGSSGDPASGQPADAAAKGMPEGETTVASTSPAPAADATIPAGHRSVLYEEGNPGEGGFAYNGRVTWSTEPDETAAGGALLVRGLVNIPQRGMKLLLTMRKNTDQSLPASHIIELLFEVPTSFTSAGIKNVPGILMKANEPTKGTALAGASKRATENYFLIGLSNAPNDLQRNLDLLRDRSWIDVPILYSNNKRAILTIEKGPDGKRIFAEAFASWTGQASSQPAQPSFVQPATSQGTQ